MIHKWLIDNYSQNICFFFNPFYFCIVYSDNYVWFVLDIWKIEYVMRKWIFRPIQLFSDTLVKYFAFNQIKLVSISVPQSEAIHKISCRNFASYFLSSLLWVKYSRKKWLKFDKLTGCGKTRIDTSSYNLLAYECETLSICFACVVVIWFVFSTTTRHFDFHISFIVRIHVVVSWPKLLWLCCTAPVRWPFSYTSSLF